MTSRGSPAVGIAGFFARVLFNEKRDSFSIRLGASLLVGQFKIFGPLAWLVETIVRGVLGVLVEDGIFVIDVTLDSIREGRKLDEFKVAAEAAYKKASARVYDEEKKNAIRKEYLEIISRIGTVGRPKP